MTQRIFDIENEQDMKDLWSILPDEAYEIKKFMDCPMWYKKTGDMVGNVECLNINWHGRTEITRPIQVATEKDIGKLCAFWDDKEPPIYGVLTRVRQHVSTLNIFQYQFNSEDFYTHCRRLTKQEIEELC